MLKINRCEFWDCEKILKRTENRPLCTTNTYNELRKILGDDIFEINRRYLDVKISEGKTFYFNVNPNDSANQTGDFLKELNYLRAKGYSFSTSINSDGFYYAIRN